MSFASGPRPFVRVTAALASIAALAAWDGRASGASCPSPAEPAACLSTDPAQWPSPSKPYFMLAVDTSSSMAITVMQNGAPLLPPCAGYPSTRNGHERCALRSTLQAFSGQVNFGLATYAYQQSGCTGSTCFPGCSYTPFVGDSSPPLPGNIMLPGCGPEPTPGAAFSASRAGANILVPMLQDHYWTNPPAATNVPQLLSYVDNSCSNSQEIFSAGRAPVNGMLRDMYRYFSTGWTRPGGAVTYPTPLDPTERGCRSVNVILISAGDENCDYPGQAFPSFLSPDAEDAARQLYQTGVNVGGKVWNVKTHVIRFNGGNTVILGAIAAAGGTTLIQATDAVSLSTALAGIIGASVKPETCDNADNNCNGCSDEGFAHYCNNQPVASSCCAWTTPAERQACLTSYQGSINAASPQGNLLLLPCATPADQTCPAQWSCFNPGDTCDGVDNNCAAGVDEGATKCGSPLHCPTPEICNGLDDDCNGVVDENNACGVCVPSPEICDGCDNDCDGFTDDGIAPIPCGLPSPANCLGQLTCKPSVAVTPGGCVAGGGYNACSNSPQPEVCDTLDNNCNGQVDENIPPTPCLPPGTPAGLVYGGASQCKMGQQACGSTACVGFVGPGVEVCDGVDNDCDGQVDEAVPNLGQPCGINQLPCTPGATACVNGAIVCQGAAGPQPEVCDGLDNDCDTLVDEAPLADAPPGNAAGCWDLPGNCCAFKNLTWCPPAGATCSGDGTLAAPCNNGSLLCGGAAGWVCSSSHDPAPETCDGIDNDCNGAVDDGSFPQVGAPCGSSVGACQPGAIACAGGVLDCVGDVPPVPEKCNGLDDDCDGVIDNGVPVGGPCTPPYDPLVYPGDRSGSPCHPGITECDGMGGVLCVGGVGPSPELCDGLDNDCDGQIDETVGVGSDSITGSPNPTAPPAASIGDDCGQSTGECKPGKWACDKGSFVCQGGSQTAVEVCDCLDNDCDGTVDNPNENNTPALCSGQNDCVKSGGKCQCTTKCGAGEFPCPPGQICDLSAVVSGTATTSPTGYCVPDCAGFCGGDCSDKTLKDGNGQVLCQPAADSAASCLKVPTCQCQCQSGCKAPCEGVVCAAGQVCAETGPQKGQCVDTPTCWNQLCQGCNKACSGGACVDAPCLPGTCPDGQECSPRRDFLGHACVTPCGAPACPGGQTCVEGACVDDCAPACAASQVCDRTQAPPACVDSKCSASSCPDGSHCDPLTGACGNYPCEDVVCPAGQSCDARTGQCLGGSASTSTSSTGGTGGSAETTTSTSVTGGHTTSTSGTGSGGAGGDTRGVWGLATGGGGCACEAGAGSSDRGQGGAAISALLLAIKLAMARRRRRDGEGAVRS